MLKKSLDLHTLSRNVYSCRGPDRYDMVPQSMDNVVLAAHVETADSGRRYVGIHVTGIYLA